MPFEFFARCSACGHDWSDLHCFSSIGDILSSPTATYSCIECFGHITVATDFDRISFENWHGGHRQEIACCPLTASFVTEIDKAFDKARYLASYIDRLDAIECPKCNRKMHKGYLEDCLLVCPQCRSESAREYAGGTHVSVLQQVEIENILEKGSGSGEPIPFTDATWQQIRAAARLRPKGKPD
jgi:hypothetical protein